MDENKFRYCTLLLIDDDNHSKIFISEENKYQIKNNNKSIHVKILNEFKDIRKSYGINVIDTTDNYYKINEPDIIKHCTFLLIDEDDRSKMFLSEKNSYCICNNFDDNYDVDGYGYFDDDYGDYYYFDYDYDDDDHYCDVDDDDVYYYKYDISYNDGYDELVYYKKPLNYFERLVSVKNNIVTATSNEDYNQNITLIVNSRKIYIS